MIVSNGGGATASVSVAENGTAVTTVSASDPDAGAVLSYSLVGGADQSQFTIDRLRRPRLLAAPDFEAPGDAGGNNVYDVAVQVSDGLGGIDIQTLAVTVTNANEAPVIVSNGGGATASVSVAENGTAVTTVSANDPDAGAVADLCHRRRRRSVQVHHRRLRRPHLPGGARLRGAGRCRRRQRLRRRGSGLRRARRHRRPDLCRHGQRC